MWKPLCWWNIKWHWFVMKYKKGINHVITGLKNTYVAILVKCGLICYQHIKWELIVLLLIYKTDLDHICWLPFIWSLLWVAIATKIKIQDKHSVMVHAYIEGEKVKIWFSIIRKINILMSNKFNSFDIMQLFVF